MTLVWVKKKQEEVRKEKKLTSAGCIYLEMSIHVIDMQ